VREEDRLAEDAATAAALPAPAVEPPTLPAFDLGAQTSEQPMPPPALPEIGFQNKVAVRIGALLAGPVYFAITFLGVLPGGPLFMLLGLLASGFLAVAMYKRRTGSVVTIISGARLGWICGLFVFLITLVLVTIVSAVATTADLSQVQEQLKQQGHNPADVQRLFEMISNPATLLMMLVTFFVMITTVPSLGGALGAKVLEPKQR